MSQHGRKRSASCREEPQSSSSAWEPASKRLRTLVHQMRSLSLGDLPWSRRKVVRDDVRPPDPPPTPDATPVPARRPLAAPAVAAAVAAAVTAAAAAAQIPPRQDAIPTVSQTTGVSMAPGSGLGGGYSATDADTAHGAKRSEDETGGARAKKARNRMRLGHSGVVMTSCYIEQTLYT